MIADVTDTIVNLTTTVFVLSTMLAVGLDLSIGQLREAMGRRRLMTKSLLVNLIVIPALAYLLVYSIPMVPSYAAGVVLLAVSPGAPFGPKLAEISDSDLAFASGLMAILAVVSVVTIPVSLALLLPGNVSVDPVAIGRLVFGVQLVPLLAGFVVTYRSSPAADALYSPVQRLSNYSFILLIVVLLTVYIDDMAALVGTGALFVSSVIVAGSLAVGYVFGGPARSTREVLATTTAARNAAVALFIATAGFSDPGVLTVVLAFSFLGVVASALLATIWRRRTTS
ncbi:bile acid:sodium symporter family protein [Halorubrum sp. AJ67]|uniref:bile acid:sodium symporter family protein n=1 Tax=Halorubrum sp. AJ67 TaxID=1173487 RepID=UPI0003DD4127|nr:sodium symporter [Halorubrum sp. AJ67]CDK39050.1 putative Na+-dependent transporter [Halorubrum sp. AJ67]